MSGEVAKEYKCFSCGIEELRLKEKIQDLEVGYERQCLEIKALKGVVSILKRKENVLESAKQTVLEL